MVFQSYALWPHMTVAKNVAFGLERRKLSRAEIAKQGVRRARAGRPFGLRGPPAGAAIGRTAAAGRARAHAGDRARGAAARRAAVKPRCQAARRDALGAAAVAAQARHHRDLRHPRPGGSERRRRPHRGARPGPHSADRHAARALRPAGQPLRRDLPRHHQPDRRHDQRRRQLSSLAISGSTASAAHPDRPRSRSARRT